MAAQVTSDWRVWLKNFIASHPAVFYKRLWYLYPGKVTRFADGYEKTDSSVLYMQDFAIRQAENSGDPDSWIKKVIYG